MDKHNEAAYLQTEVAKKYKQFQFLFPAEKIILNQFKSRWSNYTVLDLGVGGGRTSFYIAPFVKKYTGLDLSPLMVEVCQERFPNYNFIAGDAVTLDGIENESNDLVLFSFNGIDCVTEEQRATCLKNMSRVLKPQGELVFSFHNMGNLPLLYSYQWPKNPFRWAAEVKRRAMVRAQNPPLNEIKHLDRAKLFDNDKDHQLQLVYSTLKLQLQELEEQGFKVISMWDTEAGKPLTAGSITNCAWIYIHCQKI